VVTTTATRLRLDRRATCESNCSCMKSRGSRVAVVRKTD